MSIQKPLIIHNFQIGMFMSQRKDQSLIDGRFFPKDPLKIYQCEVRNTTSFLKDITLFSVLIGFFSFLLTQWLAVFIVPLTWPFLAVFLLPKHYRYLNFNKHTLTFGIGSLRNLTSRSLYQTKSYQYGDLISIRFNRWERKQRGGLKDYFGKVEIRYAMNSQPFSFLTTNTDLTELVKLFSNYRFHSKVKKNRTKGELMLIFPKSPRFIS
jgi:hypothetical protein